MLYISGYQGLSGEQQLGDLHGVGGGALADLIAAAPDVQTVVTGQILPDAAHEHGVLIAGVQRHGVPAAGQIVHQTAAGGRRR